MAPCVHCAAASSGSELLDSAAAAAYRRCSVRVSPKRLRESPRHVTASELRKADLRTYVQEGHQQVAVGSAVGQTNTCATAAAAPSRIFLGTRRPARADVPFPPSLSLCPQRRVQRRHRHREAHAPQAARQDGVAALGPAHDGAVEGVVHAALRSAARCSRGTGRGSRKCDVYNGAIRPAPTPAYNPCLQPMSK